MALTGCTTTVNYRRINDALSPALSSANFIVLCGWVKLATSEASTARGLFSCGVDSSTSTHHQSCNMHSNGNIATRIYSNTTSAVNDNVNSSLSAFWDTWIHDALIVEGPHDGTSNAWERRINDSIHDSGSFTSATFTATIDTVHVGRSAEVGGGAGADKYAYVAVGEFASLAAARTAVTACQTTAPKSVTGFVHSWDLIADANSDLGGVNLTAIGTGGSFDADDPLAGGGVAGFTAGILIM